MSAPAVRRAEVLLLVDDDPWFRRSMAIALKLEGYKVVEAGNTAEAFAALEQDPVDVALVDLLLGNERGEAVIEHLARTCPDAKLVSMSACDGLRSRVSSVDRARVHHIEKPFLAAELVALLAGPRRRAQ